MVSYFTLASSIISAIFAILLLAQYVQRRKRHQLIWTIALTMFFLSTLFDFLSQPDIVGGSVLTYKLYYVLAAPMVALLGVGTLYLLTHKPWGKYFLIYTIILIVPFFALGFTASIDPSEIAREFSEIAGEAMPQYVRYFSPLFTIPGAIFLIGGALYGFWLDKTRKYGLLIALGGIFHSSGGSLARFGNPTFLNLFGTIGILLLFLGFLSSREYIKKHVRYPKKE